MMTLLRSQAKVEAIMEKKRYLLTIELI